MPGSRGSGRGPSCKLPVGVEGAAEGIGDVARGPVDVEAAPAPRGDGGVAGSQAAVRSPPRAWCGTAFVIWSGGCLSRAAAVEAG